MKGKFTQQAMLPPDAFAPATACPPSLSTQAKPPLVILKIMDFPDDELRVRLADIFAEARKVRAFPGGVALLARGDELIAHEALGALGYDDFPEYSAPVQRDTIYDVASITKLFTASAALWAMRQNAIALDEKIARFLPAFARPEKADISIRHLLNHSSGIGFAIQELPDENAENWIARIAEEPLHAAIGERVIYSCTNYFLLARLIELWCAQPLQNIIETQFLQPLKMTRSAFFPLQHFSPEEVAPSEIPEYSANAGHSGRAWRGVVHDEAARSWEQQTATACGNAGLFSTAHDLWNFAQMWLHDGAFGGLQILDARDVRAALHEAIPANNYRQALGWNLNVTSWMGPHAPRDSAGHAAFTGPTMFLAPSTQEIVIVLNNRVFPTRDGAQRFRFHRQIATFFHKLLNLH